MQHNALCNFTVRISGMKSKWALNKIKTQKNVSQKAYIGNVLAPDEERSSRLAFIPLPSNATAATGISSAGDNEKITAFAGNYACTKVPCARVRIQRTHIHTCNRAVIIFLSFLSAHLLDPPLVISLPVPRLIFAIKAHKHCKIPRSCYRQLPALFV